MVESQTSERIYIFSNMFLNEAFGGRGGCMKSCNVTTVDESVGTSPKASSAK